MNTSEFAGRYYKIPKTGGVSCSFKFAEMLHETPPFMSSEASDIMKASESAVFNTIGGGDMPGILIAHRSIRNKVKSCLGVNFIFNSEGVATVSAKDIAAVKELLKQPGFYIPVELVETIVTESSEVVKEKVAAPIPPAIVKKKEEISESYEDKKEIPPETKKVMQAIISKKKKESKKDKQPSRRKAVK